MILNSVKRHQPELVAERKELMAEWKELDAEWHELVAERKELVATAVAQRERLVYFVLTAADYLSNFGIILGKGTPLLSWLFNRVGKFVSTAFAH